jgi:hypothetical protein
MKLGDFVSVIGQDITGYIVEIYGNKAVIEDNSSEYAAPDNRLEYHLSELQGEL